MSKHTYDEAYFEGRGSNYWWTAGSYTNVGEFPHWKKMLKLIQEFRKSGRLLDVGCAYGFLVSETSECFEAYGIDVSHFAVEKSQEKCRGVVSRASAVNLPFKSDSFDVVTLLDTLEHVTDFHQCLKDVRRVLKKGGILLLQLPNPLIWTGLCGNLGLEDETHMNTFRLEEWQEILVEYGFKVEKRVGFISFAFKKVKFFLKSESAAAVFPEIWVVAKKQN